MKNARNILLLAGVLILLAAQSSRADDVTSYVDTAKSCTVKAGSDWKRHANIEKDSIQLSLEYTKDKPGDVHPNFMVLAVTTKDTLDKSAQDLVDAAKKHVADQGDYGTISTVKLDGEDARLIVTRTTIGGKPAIRKYIIANHNGPTYIVNFFTTETDYKRQLPAADLLFDSFHWK